MVLILSGDDLWKAKIAAFLHDPPEKPGILFHTGAGGHERVAAEHRKALGFPESEFGRFAELAKRADHLAAGADRPPMTKEEWTRIDFQRKPQVIHPLSGTAYDLGSLAQHEWDGVTGTVQIAMDKIKACYSQPHKGFSEWARRSIALWRELPEFLARRRGESAIGNLWRVLPADTRNPDHSIWDHLKLTSALAGALSDPEGRPTVDPALLLVTLGPVQSFIAAARKTSDLWAGSWILSWLAWQAMLAVVGRFGPDCVIFPDLRQQPLVDLWLKQEVGLGQVDDRLSPAPADLTRASLPNRFLAVVPHPLAAEVGRAAARNAHAAMRRLAEQSIQEALPGRGLPGGIRSRVCEQVLRYLEVRWVAARWPGAFQDAAAMLRSAQAGGDDSEIPGLALQAALVGGKVEFWQARHSGPLYGDLYGLTDRCVGASKRVYDFGAADVAPGSRCAQTGEFEPVAQGKPRPSDRDDEIPVSPHLAEGEKLSAVVVMKRELRRCLTGLLDVSTEAIQRLHFPATGSIAAAPYLERLAEQNSAPVRELAAALEQDDVARDRGQSVPARTHGLLQNAGLRGLGYLDARALFADDNLEAFVDEDGCKISSAVRAAIQKVWKAHGRPTPYYALVLADGDSMGAWLSGEKAPPLANVLHPALLGAWSPEAQDAIRDHRRPLSPAHHAAVSGALRAFSSELIPRFFESDLSAKLVYSGGDDVLALLPLRDLPDLLEVLPRLFSGEPLPDGRRFFDLGRGYARFGMQPQPLMGEKASLSAGVVVAHQKAPFQSLLAAARVAEHSAKQLDGKAAVTVTILKHSGERIDFTAPWRWGTATCETTAALLGLWVAAFGDGVELCSAERRVSPRFARIWQVEIRPIIEAALHVGGSPVETVRQVFTSLLARHIEPDKELNRAELDARFAQPTVDFGIAVGRRGREEPGEVVSRLLEVALFLARHRNSARDGVRRDDAED
ncbi:MAG: type III-B CRISPR-associated protein Cas10/Cmr2 [Candidatus Binatia bacterium]